MKSAEREKPGQIRTDLDTLLELLKELDIPYEDVKQALEEGGYVEE